MAALPDTIDPTLDAIDRAIEAQENAQPSRTYLGMSSIGRPCWREGWYSFRWCGPSIFPAAAHKRFHDGHHGEAIQAQRLRLVEGITLHTLDPRTGQQFGYSDIGGHFRGHMDGVILGLLQAPKTYHVWEHKQVDDDKQAKLLKAKQEHGEKAALQAWDEVYYAQGVLYMNYSGLERHYLTCANAGGRHTISVRTEPDPRTARAMIEKARTIITSPEPLSRLSERPDWYQCKSCAFHGLCHGQRVAAVSCRTCVHATAAMDGDGRWRCERFACDISTEQQRTACHDHLFIPALLPYAKAVDACEASNTIQYRMEDGRTFRNGRPEAGCYTSWELAAADPGVLMDPNVEIMRTKFGGQIVGKDAA